MKIETIYFARQKKNALANQENQNNISSASKKSIIEKIKNRVM
jgi:hypothetical protein